MTAEVAQARRALDAALAARDTVGLEWLGEPAWAPNWAMAPDTLRLLTTLVGELRPTRVVEFGCGTSTRVLARACAQLGAPASLEAVENDPDHAAAVTAALRDDGAPQAVVTAAPLVVRRIRGHYVPVYHPAPVPFRDATPANLVVVDGPPQFLGGREGALLQALAVSARGTVILLDDAAREADATVLTIIEKMFHAAISVDVLAGFTKGLAAVLVHDAVDVAVAEQPASPEASRPLD